MSTRHYGRDHRHRCPARAGHAGCAENQRAVSSSGQHPVSRPLRSVTLHLLESLDCLLAECNVSHAAMRAGVSQSTMSNNLADLRQVFDDPLLVRQGQRLVPTARALEISGPIREALRGIADAVEGAAQFRPDRVRRQFSILTVDFVQALMLQQLVERWNTLSSRLELSALPLVPETLHEQLATGQADAAILSPRFAPTSLRHTRLYTDRFVLLAHRTHPIVGKGVDLGKYLSCTHVMVSPMGHRFSSSVDASLRSIGHVRHVRVCVPQYLTAVQLVSTTPFVVTAPASLALRATQHQPLVFHELPFDVPPLELSLVWHERSQNEPAHRWLRDELRAVFAMLPPA
jgi:DNA-binding transcriptional LysR family regulator